MTDGRRTAPGGRGPGGRRPDPRVSVIVPVFNDQERLGHCLNALRQQTFPRDRFEVIVVDNGSSPPVTVADPPTENLVLLREERPGSYAARNAGAGLARGEILAFTDSDCIPDSRWLSSAMELLEGDSTCSVVAGHVDVFPRDPSAPTAVELYDIVFAFPQERYAATRRFGVTANLVVRKSVFERVGPFDAALPSGGDVEWGQRAYQCGIPARYAPEIRVAHPARHSWAQLTQKCRRVAFGEYLLLKGGRTGKAAYWTRWVTPPVRKAFRTSRAARLSAGARLSLAVMTLGLHYLHLYEVARWYFRGESGDTGAVPVR